MSIALITVLLCVQYYVVYRTTSTIATHIQYLHPRIYMYTFTTYQHYITK